MSKLLLTAPRIFMVLSDPVRGPPLLRVIVSIMEDKFDMGEGWGEHDHEEEQVWVDLLRDEHDDVRHFFQQIGLNRDIVRDDLRRLSKEVPGTRPNKNKLLVFKKQYPVIFAALEAVFGLMPSNSRIAEQAHGGLRDSLSRFVSLTLTDMRQQFMMGAVYEQREVRRMARREQNEARAIPEGSDKILSRRVKHSEYKSDQQMCGIQLLESGQQYTREKISKLPVEFLKENSIGSLKKRGLMEKDKKVRKRKQEVLEDKIDKRRGTQHDPEYFEQQAASAVVNNDRVWTDPTTTARLQDLKKLSSKSFWGDLHVKNDTPEYCFRYMLEHVLPDFWEAIMTSRSKNSIMGQLKPYLDALKAKVEAETVVANQRAILEEAVKVDATTYLDHERAELQTFKSNAARLFDSCGTEISDGFRGFGAEADEDWEEESEEEESDDDLLFDSEPEWEYDGNDDD